MSEEPWPILVVDDDEGVLRLTELMLSRVTVDGRALRIELCRSAAEARVKLMDKRYALAIIDVVMETEHAGLELVRAMRGESRHDITPIVIRTGQPGVVPEAKVLQDFRISDYWRKDELQPHRVRASVTGLIRGYELALALEQRSHERAVLLKEIHHRVKNNLQTVASLLMLQRDQLPSERGRTMLDESVFRVRSMALVHEQLYGVDSLERIDFAEYAKVLTDTLKRAMAPALALEVRASPTMVSIEVAVPLGLILNELVTNALKYGASSNPEVRARLGADVVVEVALVDDAVVLGVEDAGDGVPAGLDPSRTPTLGLQLVRSLVRQLRATLTIRPGVGARFELRAPREPVR
jgi:two-component sensor histidine kinase